MSTKTGFPPARRIELIVEQKVNDVVMTSSPSFKPKEIREI